MKEKKVLDANLKFWRINEKNDIEIIQRKLIEFLNQSGFLKVKLSDTAYVLVKETNNMVKEISDHIIVDYVRKFLQRIDEPEVYEEFLSGSSGYISKPKLRFLDTAKLVNDRDDIESSWFHFKDKSWQVDKKNEVMVSREQLQNKIWESRIIPHEFSKPIKPEKSQFEKFCFNLSGKKDDRFLSLKTIIGYLLHRNQDPANAKAVIFVDENISFDGSANGGTGKSLLLKAIGKCREVVTMDGKNIKHGSWFKNQRIKRTTDIVFYDDVGSDFSLESLYSMITTGITVERKHKDEEYIKPEDAPKICISSNYVVRGTGGSTDIRRRCEFEVANHYDSSYSPYDEFGNYFFIDWDDNEWNSFYQFMMKCVREYLINGLKLPKVINLKKNRLINATSIDFVVFMELGLVEINNKYSKAEIFKLFKSDNPHKHNLSLHQMTKWMKEYAKHNNLEYIDKKSGENYDFWLNEKRKETSDEEE